MDGSDETQENIPQPLQPPRDAEPGRHDYEIQVADDISRGPGDEHGCVHGERPRHDIWVAVVDGPYLDGAGEDLREGCEDGTAGEACFGLVFCLWVYTAGCYVGWEKGKA